MRSSYSNSAQSMCRHTELTHDIWASSMWVRPLQVMQHRVPYLTFHLYYENLFIYNYTIHQYTIMILCVQTQHMIQIIRVINQYKNFLMLSYWIHIYVCIWYVWYIIYHHVYPLLHISSGHRKANTCCTYLLCVARHVHTIRYNASYSSRIYYHIDILYSSNMTKVFVVIDCMFDTQQKQCSYCSVFIQYTMYVVGIHLYMYITLPIRYTNISSQTEYSAGVST